MTSRATRTRAPRHRAAAGLCDCRLRCCGDEREERCDGRRCPSPVARRVSRVGDGVAMTRRRCGYHLAQIHAGAPNRARRRSCPSIRFRDSYGHQPARRRRGSSPARVTGVAPARRSSHTRRGTTSRVPPPPRATPRRCPCRRHRERGRRRIRAARWRRAVVALADLRSAARGGFPCPRCAHGFSGVRVGSTCCAAAISGAKLGADYGLLVAPVRRTKPRSPRLNADSAAFPQVGGEIGDADA